jgi:Phospholipase_D-nuclease N-terminal
MRAPLRAAGTSVTLALSKLGTVVMPLATTTFLHVLFALMIAVPVVILWVAAVVDVLRRGGAGLRIAAVLVLILIFPILGPLLYFVFRRPEPARAAGGPHTRSCASRMSAASRSAVTLVVFRTVSLGTPMPAFTRSAMSGA